MSRRSNATPQGDPRISPTAYATAAAWAHYGFAEAEAWDSRRGRAMLGALRFGTWALSPILPALAPGEALLYWRHYWFSAWVARITPSLAIEIGAGLSTRGLAYARAHPKMSWHDLDLPGMIATRRALPADLPPANHHLAVGDLLDERLGAHIAAPTQGPVVALTEGVVDYLNRDAKQRAWAHIAALLKRLGGGRYLTEVYPLRQFAPRGPGAALARRWAARPGSTLCYHEDQALAGLEAAGFARARVLPDTELPGVAYGPRGSQRAFCLLEAET